ncbi:hypothetical protein N7463_008220 [Penicillium fimorum]|uniref:Uncharacterized protein n=1 Tax=Penicillium fimorum TaxID=1882269 RepID=A0A9W9XNG6_9EURO|nr:hypothetical protein N7463_008220 [Penicillium fimorum]
MESLIWLQSSLELKYGNAYKVFGEARDMVVQPAPEKLSARYDTNSSLEAWQQPEPHFHDAERTGDADHTAKVKITKDSWFSVSSAIGQELQVVLIGVATERSKKGTVFSVLVRQRQLNLSRSRSSVGKAVSQIL